MWCPHSVMAPVYISALYGDETRSQQKIKMFSWPFDLEYSFQRFDHSVIVVINFRFPTLSSKFWKRGKRAAT